MEPVLGIILLSALLIVGLWIIVKLRRIIWGILLFVIALVGLGTWEYIQEAVPELGLIVAVVVVFVGALRFAIKGSRKRKQ